MDKFYDQTTSFHGKPQQTAPNAEQSENLAALGYVSSSAAGQSPDQLQGADPKDKIEISNILHEGMIAVEDGRYNEAIPMLQHVLADSPAITAAQLQLGIALARTKRYTEAIPALKKAIEQVPDAVQAKYELALALFETGAWQESAPYFETVAEKRPKWVDAQYSLASVYARINRVPEAVELLNKVLEMSPDHFRANLLLGRIIYLQGDPAVCRAAIRKSRASRPEISRGAQLSGRCLFPTGTRCGCYCGNVSAPKVCLVKKNRPVQSPPASCESLHCTQSELIPQCEFHHPRIGEQSAVLAEGIAQHPGRW